MPQLHLTELTVRSLKSDTTAYFWDTTLPAFGIRVGKTKKTWTIIKGQNRDRVTVGHYPDMTLSEARTAAKRLLLDPVQRRTSLAFHEALELFLSHHPGKDRTKREIRRLLTKHFYEFHKNPLGEITTHQVNRIIDSLRSTPSECLHTWKAARTLFLWAERRDFVEKSPLSKSQPPTRERVGDLVLSEQALKRIYLTVQTPLSVLHGICHFLILTGQRKAQAAQLHSSWITPDGILFPASVMKAGREHLIPVTPMIADMLPKREGYLFPSKNDGPFVGFSASTKKLCERSGVDFHIHSLRRTAATQWGRFAQPHVIQSLLSHSWGGVTSRYNRYDYFEEKRACLLQWERWLEALTKEA